MSNQPTEVVDQDVDMEEAEKELLGDDSVIHNTVDQETEEELIGSPTSTAQVTKPTFVTPSFSGTMAASVAMDSVEIRQPIVTTCGTQDPEDIINREVNQVDYSTDNEDTLDPSYKIGDKSCNYCNLLERSHVKAECEAEVQTSAGRENRLFVIKNILKYQNDQCDLDDLLTKRDRVDIHDMLLTNYQIEASEFPPPTTRVEEDNGIVSGPDFKLVSSGKQASGAVYTVDLLLPILYRGKRLEDAYPCRRNFTENDMNRFCRWIKRYKEAEEGEFIVYDYHASGPEFDDEEIMEIYPGCVTPRHERETTPPFNQPESIDEQFMEEQPIILSCDYVTGEINQLVTQPVPIENKEQLAREWDILKKSGNFSKGLLVPTCLTRFLNGENYTHIPCKYIRDGSGRLMNWIYQAEPDKFEFPGAQLLNKLQFDQIKDETKLLRPMAGMINDMRDGLQAYSERVLYLEEKIKKTEETCRKTASTVHKIKQSQVGYLSNSSSDSGERSNGSDTDVEDNGRTSPPRSNRRDRMKRSHIERTNDSDIVPKTIPRLSQRNGSEAMDTSEVRRTVNVRPSTFKPSKKASSSGITSRDTNQVSAVKKGLLPTPTKSKDGDKPTTSGVNTRVSRVDTPGKTKMAPPPADSVTKYHEYKQQTCSSKTKDDRRHSRDGNSSRNTSICSRRSDASASRKAPTSRTSSNRSRVTGNSSTRDSDKKDDRSHSKPRVYNIEVRDSSRPSAYQNYRDRLKKKVDPSIFIAQHDSRFTTRMIPQMPKDYILRDMTTLKLKRREHMRWVQDFAEDYQSRNDYSSPTFSASGVKLPEGLHVCPIYTAFQLEQTTDNRMVWLSLGDHPVEAEDHVVWVELAGTDPVAHVQVPCYDKEMKHPMATWPTVPQTLVSYPGPFYYRRIAHSSMGKYAVKCFIDECCNHSTNDCPLSVWERRSLLRKQEKCFNCLLFFGDKGDGIDHVCANFSPCDRCGRYGHNTAICGSVENLKYLMRPDVFFSLEQRFEPNSYLKIRDEVSLDQANTLARIFEPARFDEFVMATGAFNSNQDFAYTNRDVMVSDYDIKCSVTRWPQFARTVKMHIMGQSDRVKYIMELSKMIVKDWEYMPPQVPSNEEYPHDEGF